MEFTKRSRSSNWGHDEKETLLALVKERISIIENKSWDGRMLAIKHKAWMEVMEKFDTLHGGRDLKRLKEQWKRMKRNSKAAIRMMKNYKNSIIDGGPVPGNVTIPTKPDLEIKDLIPREHVKDSNFADDGDKQDLPIIYIAEEVQDNEEASDADWPRTSNTMDESIEKCPIEIQETRSTAELPENPYKRQRKTAKRKNASGLEEVMAVLKIQGAKSEAEREQIKRKREMDEELHNLQIGLCKKEAELLNDHILKGGLSNYHTFTICITKVVKNIVYHRFAVLRKMQ
ncbi:hypothetical protein J437_LFUL016394 [Ladona fulva]|uniref:Regulatory protein zeste n=1 Tax=Ladona fulva TaxID=123851 RepID=A0A8K0NWD0_LADFU|nr:hypothetical protein J437_LFUL016394 [Ladona fulva]